MRDALRAELSGLPSLRIDTARLRIGREPVGWAFLCAVGAGFIVAGILMLVLVVASPILFPPTQQRPIWLNGGTITRFASVIAIGAVAVRSGGLGALALYLGYELLQLVAQSPGRQLSCERNPGIVAACDPLSVVVGRWPTWLALAIGAVASRWLPAASDDHPNPLLRAAGVFSVVLTAATALAATITFLTVARRQLSSGSDPFPIVMDVVSSATYVIGALIAGMLAGLVLGRRPPAATLLIALLAMISLPFALTLARQQTGPPTLLIWSAFVTWASVIAPLMGALGLGIGRVLASGGRSPD